MSEQTDEWKDRENIMSKFTPKMRNEDKIERAMERKFNAKSKTQNIRAARTLKSFTKIDDQFADEMLTQRGR